MTPPMMMRLAIYENGKKKMNLWLPLILLYLLLLPLVVFLLPFLVLGGVVLWIFGGGETPFSIWPAMYELWCATKGVIIETKTKNDRILIRIF